MNSFFSKLFGTITGLVLITIAGLIIYWITITNHSVGEIVGMSFWVLILFVFGVSVLLLALLME